jgi:oleandomycin transport system ATP-binding protein
VLEVAPADPGQLPAVAEMLARYAGVEPTAEPRAGRVSAPVADAAALPDIVRRLYDAGIVLTEFTLRKTSLDEVFLTLTGHQANKVPAQPAGEEPARKTERIPA